MALLEHMVQLPPAAGNTTLAGYMYVSGATNQVRLDIATFGQVVTIFWDTITGVENIVYVGANGQLMCTKSSQPYVAIPQSLKYNGQAPCGYNGQSLCNRFDFVVTQGPLTFTGSVLADVTTNALDGELLTCTYGGNRVLTATLMFDSFSASVPQTPGFFDVPSFCAAATAPTKADELLLRALPRHPLFL